MKRCLLCGQSKEHLAKAHIFSLGFFSQLPTKARVDTVNLSGGAGRRLPSALYDYDILCHECEHGTMQPLDDYGIKVIRDKKRAFRIPLSVEAQNSVLVFEGIDKRKIRAFIASVFWRCSVSKQPEVRGISIGPVYEDRIRYDLLRGGEFNYVDAVLFYLTHALHGAFILPTRKRLRPLDTSRDSQMINGWILQFPNISITVSLDKRPHPHRMLLKLAPDLTGRAESLPASTCLKPDAQEYNLLALKTETQENHMEHIIEAIRRHGMKPPNQALKRTGRKASQPLS